MIKLTNKNGKPIYLQPNKIIAVEEGNMNHYTRIWTGGGDDDYLLVQEHPEEVARKVLEYRVIFAQHQAYIRNEETYSYAHDASRALRVLAGLEESQ